jgi:hypothetical protein
MRIGAVLGQYLRIAADAAGAGPNDTYVDGKLLTQKWQDEGSMPPRLRAQGVWRSCGTHFRKLQAQARSHSRLLIPHLLEHFLHVVQLDRPLVFPLILAKHKNLAARDLVALDGALLREERVDIANEGARDVWR